jgi:hypothetical protein
VAGMNNEGFNAAFDEMQALRAVLWSDLSTALDAYKSSDTPYSRRVFVRAGVCFLDAITFTLRHSLVQGLAFDHVAAEYTERERRLLSDRLALEKEYRNLPDRFRFCIEMTAKPFMERPVIDAEKDEGWRAFKRALKVRHRITHPETASSLEVLPKEVLDVGIACHWTARCGGTVFEAMGERLEADDVLQRIREHNRSLDGWLVKYMQRRPEMK